MFKSVYEDDEGNCSVLVSPRLCKYPFLRLVGGRGGGGGGGGMRLDNSVDGERAGGAGGGASRPAPVTMGNQCTGVKEVQVIHVNIVKKGDTQKPLQHIFSQLHLQFHQKHFF